MRSGFAEFRHLVVNDPMEVILPLGIFAATFLACWVARRLVMRALRAWTARTESRAGTVVYEALRGPTMIWALILAVHMAFQGSDLPVKFTHPIASVLLVLWIVSLTLMSMRVVGNLVRYHGSQFPGALPVTTLTQNLAQISVVILGGLILLNHFNVSITPILTALGVGGLAVALALQDTLSNLFGGFYVAVAGQVRLGDYVKLNTGEEGYVTDIGWRCTTFRAMQHNLIIVPNAKLAQAIVTNYYLPEKRMSASFAVTVDYECDPDAVEKALAEVLAQAAGEVPGMLADPAPAVAFDPGFGETGMGFTASFQVADFASQFPVRNELKKRVLRRLRAEGMGIPYPSRTVYLRGSRGGRTEGGAEIPGTKDL
ncbi:MAG: mechanosensitive ion channel family protein [Candidatus Solibacter sp.]|jgi:small-conductance mechanosensitive channel